MNLVDTGSGPPIVVIPGIQGRWEWMRPAVQALAQRLRVLTFSLADEPPCRADVDVTNGFECYVQQVADVLDSRGIERAAICGVSYGGLIAAAFAARHPERVSSLILVSALPPSWMPDARVKFYLRAPWLLSPLFLVASLRMYKEIAAANDGVFAGLAAAIRHGANVLAHMFHPGRMARRARLLPKGDETHRLSTLEQPVLVITGEATLDRVVPVRATLEYLRIFPRAVHARLPRTGHLGLITTPAAFADVVVPFVQAAAHGEASRRHIG